MGRRAKTQFNRNKTQERQPYDRVLIVCEGKKTEINYFRGLIDNLKLNTANIKILDINKNTPDSLFKAVEKLYQQSKRDGNIFDRVYCIFDKDRHTQYQATKNKIDNIRQPKNTYYYAFSEPCFEYWLLLHYEDTTKPFICFDELRKDKKFRKHFPGYQKNQDIFTERLQDKIETACQNAKNNPHTNINELVEYLQNIKNR